VLEAHERESRRATGAGEFVLADEKPRMIKILLRMLKDTYVSKRLQTTVGD
jgi:hypothetical protein